MLVSNGIGCVRADGDLPARFVLDDPLAHAQPLAVTATHALWGSYLRHAPLVTTDAPGAPRGAPAAGEHTRAILAELGYSPSDVDALLTARAAA
jgi:crotonobetainyl-CoA:carnitine CoA-transferase CaiB-like acyl-CoA transferase